jgi:hypothetical protein
MNIVILTHEYPPYVYAGGTVCQGIPEAVVQGETGLLSPFEPVGAHDFEPEAPEQFSVSWQQR